MSGKRAKGLRIMITQSVLLKVNPLPETRLTSGFSEDQDLTRARERVTLVLLGQENNFFSWRPAVRMRPPSDTRELNSACRMEEGGREGTENG